MATVLDTINVIREETISIHYSAAFAELQDKVKAEPLRTVFHIYSGCVSEKVAAEIAHRFVNGGIKAIPSKTGVVSTQHYLIVDVALPQNFIHEEKKEEEIVVASTL